MKKSCFISAVICSFLVLFCSTFSPAQGAYIRVGAGYGIGIGKGSVNSYFQREIMVDVLKQKVFNQNMVNVSKPEKQAAQIEFVKESFGEGINAGFASGYMFSRHVGIEVEFAYFMGKKIKSQWAIPEEPIFLTDEKEARAFFITPSLVISATRKGISPYARLGIVTGIAPVISSVQTVSGGAYKTIVQDELTKGIALGVSGALGATCPLGNKLSVFGEVKYSSLNYTPKQRKITHLIENGTEKPVTNVFDFPVQKLVKVNVENSDYALKADTQNAHAYPFSNISLNIGLKLNLTGTNTWNVGE